MDINYSFKACSYANRCKFMEKQLKLPKLKIFHLKTLSQGFTVQYSLNQEQWYIIMVFSHLKSMMLKQSSVN